MSYLSARPYLPSGLVRLSETDRISQTEFVGEGDRDGGLALNTYPSNADFTDMLGSSLRRRRPSRRMKAGENRQIPQLWGATHPVVAFWDGMAVWEHPTGDRRLHTSFSFSLSPCRSSKPEG